jgi:hypothetical protein
MLPEIEIFTGTIDDLEKNYADEVTDAENAAHEPDVED